MWQWTPTANPRESSTQISSPLRRSSFQLRSGRGYCISGRFVCVCPVILPCHLPLECCTIHLNRRHLSEDGLPDIEKMQLIVFDPVHHGYVQLGDKVGQAFAEYKKL